MKAGMDKGEIRGSMRARRAKLTQEEVLEYSGVIWRKIYGMESFQGAGTILLYSSFANEVSTVALAQKALEIGKTVAYPVTNLVNNTMEFYRVKDLSELRPVKTGSFNFSEPEADWKAKVVPDGDTLMIVPGLAFDREGYRTGYGGGFYDKYIAKYPSLTTLGVCYDFQLVTRIPRDDYDQPVGSVVTEKLDR